MEAKEAKAVSWSRWELTQEGFLEETDLELV